MNRNTEPFFYYGTTMKKTYLALYCPSAPRMAFEKCRFKITIFIDRLFVCRLVMTSSISPSLLPPPFPCRCECQQFVFSQPPIEAPLQSRLAKPYRPKKLNTTPRADPSSLCRPGWLYLISTKQKAADPPCESIPFAYWCSFSHDHQWSEQSMADTNLSVTMHTTTMKNGCSRSDGIVIKVNVNCETPDGPKCSRSTCFSSS